MLQSGSLGFGDTSQLGSLPSFPLRALWFLTISDRMAVPPKGGHHAHMRYHVTVS